MSKAKKRNRSVDSCSSLTSNAGNDKENSIHDQHNKELFLSAFEKPTQIYRYLRHRHQYSPIFLNRTLSYMKHRMSRNHKNRKTFKVDSLLERIQNKAENDNQQRSQNLTIIIKGIEDSSRFYSDKNSVITIDVTLLKICHKKRKDTIAPVTSTESMSIRSYITESNVRCVVAKCEIPLIQHNHIMNCAKSFSVNKDQFNLSNKNLVKSYSLLFTANISHSASGEVINEETMSDGSEIALKKRKIETKVYFKAELVVFDKNQRCLLEDGEYELVLQECVKPLNGSPINRYKPSSWEEIPINNSKLNGLIEKQRGFVLHFNLFWSDQITGRSYPMSYLSSHFDGANNENSSLMMNHCSGAINGKTLTLPSKVAKMVAQWGAPKTRIRVTYQFMHHNNTLQQTTASYEMRCPWCSINCVQINCLMKHLKLCHNRLNFSLVTDAKGHRIDVTINESFDGSYSGNPQDLSHSTTGFAFSRHGPVRRTPVTLVLVSKARKVIQSLSEFFDADDVDAAMRPFVSGHDRLYYHTATCMPISPQEIDEDSEAENDPEWMRIKTQLMIDEFTDVNEGEKEVMKLWNLHVMKHGFVGDCQIPLALQKFVDNNWRDIVNKNLYKNFIAHLSNLFDYGLLSATTMRSTIRRFNQLRKQDKSEENSKLDDPKVKGENNFSLNK
ncbi:Polycomb protein suz12-B-like protein [Dinothrombium tinctorium]|uniref:Polycomb protein suz12-B-like protein n=1 Tax=Dinothrombium tinctorium TaxID=1965070 RepID=A0A3S3S992_9ACAR|nr:Polycomb protein suz12-B-like protein [Dinothrombium tinctorium]RWS10931.1 Polycomb protein suz12-B-like protein [Dinothrombium tinctorium]RWS10971.1 Polycomb protein suz12-B-like protein [Dinothrombium tinctorium]